MDPRRARQIALGVVTCLLVVGLATPVLASPAPVTGCPPCGHGFVRAAADHGLETEVAHGEATVRVHRNGSATWTARVVPTNGTVLERLATNGTLAAAVARDSFGVRYGGGIEQRLLGVEVTDDAFVMRYRSRDVVRPGPFGTLVLTYFRDAPGAYVYTELGADELTVVAPPGMTVVRGFGPVSDDRMTATALPDVRNGPFVVFAPEGSAAPAVLGWFAVADALGGIVVRNLAYFVALPGMILVGGFAGIRRFVDAEAPHDPARVGGLVAGGGALALVGSIVSEGDALPAVTGNLLLGGLGGAVLLVLGVGVASPRVRRHLTGGRLAAVGVVVGIVALAITDGFVGAGSFHRTLSLAAGLLPVAVALGWTDARAGAVDGLSGNRLFLGLSVAVVGVLVVAAPLRALGGSLFLLVPLLLTVAAVGVVAVAVPLYRLGGAGATAEADRAPGR